MGILKKIFKPVSKVLDKIIPNEIKPFLPYAAAAFPMLYGGGLGGTTTFQQMLRRAAASGALNIGGQLAQEGSEGDINLLSAGLASLAGGMTAPGIPGVEGVAQLGIKGTEGIPGAAEYFAGKGGETAMGEIYGGLGKASKYMTDPGLSKYSIPLSHGTADVMFAEAKRAEDDAEDAGSEETAGYTDAAYRAAIRKSMTAYGATEEEILKAIEAAGYRSGGRVGLEWGGMPRAIQAVEEKETEWITQKPEWETVKRDLNNIFQESGGLEGDGMNAVGAYVRDNNLNYEWLLEGDEIKVKEKENMGEPVNILDSIDGSNTVNINGLELLLNNKANGGRIGFDNGGDLSEFKIGDHRPLKYTGAIDDIWESEELGSDPLSVIVKMGMTVRAPLIDVIRNVAKSGAEAAKLIAAATKMGWDLTKPARELVGDIGELGLEGIKEGLGHSDKFRWMTKPYLALRMSGLNDAEARLNLQDTHIGEFRKDKDLINMLENKLMDEKVGESPDQISMEEVELYPGRGEKTSRMSLRADGGMMSVLPRGKEMDYRGGGVIPVGSRERADDVPARLSKNEFVMTADAVKAAGGGSVNRGAK